MMNGNLIMSCGLIMEISQSNFRQILHIEDAASQQKQMPMGQPVGRWWKISILISFEDFTYQIITSTALRCQQLLSR